MTNDTFAIARDWAWRLPLMIIGATDGRSVVRLDGEAVDLHFGIARLRVPYADVRDVRPRDWSWWLGYGIRIAGDKTLGLVGSSRGVVQIALREPTVEGVLFMRRPRNIAVSLEDPAGFIAAVEFRLGSR